MSIQERPILLRNLRNYLTFLKDYGFSEIPLESGVTLKLPSDTNKLSHCSVGTDKRPEMKAKKIITIKSNISIEEVREELVGCTPCDLF